MNGEFIVIFSLCSFFAVFYLILMFFLDTVKKIDASHFVFISIVVVMLLLVRVFFLDKTTNDFLDCLFPWVKSYSELSFKDFLLSNISNYNFSYLYILFFISKISVIFSFYLIKLVSISFDIFLALIVGQIANLTKFGKKWGWFIILLILALPTIWLNSAAWGQCDVFYTTFVFVGLFLFFKKRFSWSMLCFGLALSFKLQAIFIFPVILIFLCKSDLKIKNIIFLILGFLLPMIPPLIAGRGLVATFNIYLNQVLISEPGNEMTYNAPNIWSVMNIQYDDFWKIVIWITITIVSVITFYICTKKNKPSNGDYIKYIFMFSIIVPYLLPKMHERYFYMAEVMSILYWAFNPKKWYFPLILQICSLSNYSNYLFGRVLFDLKIGGILIGVMTLILIVECLRGVPKKNL